MRNLIKPAALLMLGLCVYACNNSKEQSVNDEEKLAEQIEQVKAGLLIAPETGLTAEQKELKTKIYQVLLEYVEVDVENNHLRLALTEQEFKDKGLDESLYKECLSEIDNINAYVDQSGKGKEMMESWTKSKEEYLKQIAKE